jgi:hypothetical protein
MATGSMETKGFFAALFDFGFTSFITLRFLKVIYAILVGLILLFGLVFLLAGLSRGGGEAFATILLAPLGTLLYLIFTRISMEVIAVFFRIGEHTETMAASLTGRTPPPAATGYGGGFPGAPTGPSTPTI